MRGELDWIVMKALEKDRTRRYETANGLAARRAALPGRRTGAGGAAEHRPIGCGSSCGVIAAQSGNRAADDDAPRCRHHGQFDPRCCAMTAERLEREQRDAADKAEKAAKTQRDEVRGRPETIPTGAFMRCKWRSHGSRGRRAAFRERAILLQGTSPESMAGIDLRGFESALLEPPLRAKSRPEIREREQLCLFAGRPKAALALDGAVDEKGNVIEPSELRITDSRNGNLLQSWKYPDSVNDMVFSPDGVYIALACDDSKKGRAGVIHIWNLRDGKLVRSLRLPMEISHVRFSPNGRFLAAVADRQHVHVWECPSARKLHDFDAGDANILNIVFDSTGRTLKAGTDGPILSWNLRTGEALPEVILRAYPRDLVFSPDGSQVAAQTGKEGFGIWDAVTGQRLFILDPSVVGGMPFAFSPDGSLLASGNGDGTIRIWNAREGTLISTYRCPSGISRLAFSLDNTRLASGGEDLLIWDATDLQEWAD